MRELLAERLGDRSLNIAYWLPEREIFVDDTRPPGRAARPRAPGRTWTAVEHDGVRVAAIVHDAELDATPELVTAAASAAALAIDNERLKAELRARVEELRVSRLRIVEAADDARRQIERDLHDGAQQQLVSLALDLRMLKARLGDSGLPATVDQIGEKLAEALAELREFARGIHPGVPVRARRRRGGRGAGGARAAERRGVGGARRAAARAGRGRGVLRDRRGADQRRPLRRDAQRARCSVQPRRAARSIVVVTDDGTRRRDDRGRHRACAG